MYLDQHYGGWEEVVEQYPTGTMKKSVRYDENDQIVDIYYYDENGNLLVDSEEHPIKEGEK